MEVTLRIKKESLTEDTRFRNAAYEIKETLKCVCYKVFIPNGQAAALGYNPRKLRKLAVNSIY